MGLVWTVLGGSPAWPNPGQAASGYLVERDGQADAGRLRHRASPPSCERHDPGPLTDDRDQPLPRRPLVRPGAAALRLPVRQLEPTGRGRRCTCRPGGRTVLDTVAAVWDGSVETFEAGLRHLASTTPTADLRLGDLRLHRSRPACTTPPATRSRSTRRRRRSSTRPTPPRPSGWPASPTAPTCSSARRRCATPPNDSPERGHMDAARGGDGAALRRGRSGCC